MKLTDKNIIMITSGGIGKRFGSSIPKQYMEINGRKVISYVIEACKQSKLADAILVVAHSNYHNELKTEFGVDVTESGEQLNASKRNGLDYIRSHCACKKLVVVDAVRPTIESDLLDKFFTLLDEYEAVACARKITDSLGHYGEWVVNREEYFTLNAPEGFRFNLIDKHLREDSPITESIQQLPDTTRVYLDFDAPYYEKLTYPEDFTRLQLALNKKFLPPNS